MHGQDLTAQEFLAEIFGDELDEGQFNISTLTRDGLLHVQWFKNTQEAGEHAQRSELDTYFSVGIFPDNMKPRKKGRAKDVIGLAALQLDVDFEHPVNVSKQGQAPRNEEEAYEFIHQAAPFPPTIITHTGHGLQAFWAFKEPWIFEEDEEHKRAYRLAKKFWHHMDYMARGKGWKLDSTFNLDRIMRVCGTYNVAKDPAEDPKPVYCVELTREQYTGDDIEDRLFPLPSQAQDEAQEKNREYLEGNDNPYNLELDKDARMPEEEWEELLEIEPELTKLWLKKADTEKKREGQDTSLSGYDMSIANILAIYEWSPQNIANTIICFRRKHATSDKDLHKALRYDYHTRLLNKVYEARAKQEADDKFDSLYQKRVEQQMQGRVLSENEANKLAEEARAKIGARLQVRFEKILKYMSEPPEYEIVLRTGDKVPVGEAKELVTQSNLQTRIFEATDIWFTRQTSKDWHHIVTCFGAIMEEVQTGDETRSQDATAQWLQDYVRDAGIWEDEDDAFLSQRPFRRQGQVFIFLGSFKRYVATTKGEKLNYRSLGNTLKKLGCASERPNFYDEKKGRRVRTTVYDISPALAAVEEATEN